MEYQKIANLIDDTSNRPYKFRTRDWVKINDESRGAYNVNSQIKFKTTMLKNLVYVITVMHIFLLRELLVLITLLLQMLMQIMMIKK